MKKPCPNTICSLVYEIHLDRNETLEIPIPDNIDQSTIQKSDLFSINENIIMFESLEARNQCVSDFTFSSNASTYKETPPQWFQLAYKLWRCEIRKDDKASGRLLSLVNEDDDIFSLASDIIESNDMRTFDVLHLIEASLPYLQKINLNGLIRLCTLQHQHTKNDGMGGSFFNKLEPILIQNSNYCITLHTLISENPLEEIQSLYHVALTSLVISSNEKGIKLLLTDANDSNQIIKSSSTWTLGSLLSQGKIPELFVTQAEEAVLNNISDSDEKVRNSAISTASRCLIESEAFDNTLISLAKAGDQTTLCSIAHNLSLHTESFKALPKFNLLVRQLTLLKPENKGCIDSLDHLLYQLINNSVETLAIELLTSWIKNNDPTYAKYQSLKSLFNSTIYTIMENSELTSKVITDWYLSDEIQLATAATSTLEMMRVSNAKHIVFDRERIDSLNNNDLIFLARRLLGYVFDDDFLLSLSNSLLNTVNAEQRTFGIVFELFVNEVGEDFPRTTIEFIESVKATTSDSKTKDLYGSAIKTISEKSDALHKLPRITEFYPNTELEKGLNKARAKQMNIAMEDANKDSIVSMITTRIPLKAGLGSFNHRNGEYSDTSFLHEFSTETSIPRRTVTDEVGQNIQIYMMRNSKRNKQ